MLRWNIIAARSSASQHGSSRSFTRHSLRTPSAVVVLPRADPGGFLACVPHSWFETLDAWLVRFFSAFAAALIIAYLAYFVAPASRGRSLLGFVFGAGAAYALSSVQFAASAWGEFVVGRHRWLGRWCCCSRHQRGNVFTTTSRGAPQNALTRLLERTAAPTVFTFSDASKTVSLES